MCKSLVSLNYFVHHGTADEVKVLVELGLIAVLKKRVNSMHEHTRIEAIQMICNLGTMDMYRNELVDGGMLQILVEVRT